MRTLCRERLAKVFHGRDSKPKRDTVAAGAIPDQKTFEEKDDGQCEGKPIFPGGTGLRGQQSKWKIMIRDIFLKDPINSPSGTWPASPGTSYRFS